MRHYRDQRAIAEAVAEMYHQHGARIVDQDGVLFALFFDDATMETVVAKINIDRLAADIERRLSCVQ
ncbi:hypothetical protein [Shinella sp. BYT-45]|uniref:hypothetical protein n=1 Tax=Shinella sp. BYT-45 TaxID=3377377 RepID=UPI003980ED4B